jgi:CheY-like chemotaxis protein
MPGMTGGELLALLRKRQDLRGTAIAIYTAYGTLQSAIESLKTGADDYLIKPLDLIVLEKQLTEIINKRRASVTSEHPQLRVFLCHASQDKPDVRKLHTRLKHDGYSPWLDEAELVGGQDWDLEIRRAVRSSDVVIVCLSQTAVGKTGYLQKEIKQALDIADEQPEGTIFIIPLKLDDCEVPDRLGRWQWIHLNQRGGYQQLLRSLRRRTK